LRTHLAHQSRNIGDYVFPPGGHGTAKDHMSTELAVWVCMCDEKLTTSRVTRANFVQRPGAPAIVETCGSLEGRSKGEDRYSNQRSALHDCIVPEISFLSPCPRTSMAVPARFSISINFTFRKDPIAQSTFSQCQEPTQAMSIPVGPSGFNLALKALQADLGFESGRLVDVELRAQGVGSE
jgi:hypothetical protein